MPSSESKAQFTATINSELMSWVDENIKGRRFSSRSHACEYAFARLRADSDGTLYRLSGLWDENESGEPCYPEIISPQDLGRLLYPDFEAVEAPLELEGWVRYPPLPGYFQFRYERDIGPFWLVIETDKGQQRIAATLLYNEKPFVRGDYNLATGRWIAMRRLSINDREVANLQDFANEFTKFAEKLDEIYERK